jgi:hypothetical protein
MKTKLTGYSFKKGSKKDIEGTKFKNPLMDAAQEDGAEQQEGAPLD